MWRYVAGIAVFGIVVGTLIYQALHTESDFKANPLVGAVLFVPFLAWFVARFLLHGGAEGFRWLRTREVAKWSGMYYEYGRTHLRALDHEGDLVFVEDDILAVIEQPQSMTVTLFGPAERVEVPGTPWKALTRAGCERLLRKCPHPEAKGLLHYLLGQAFGPWDKRRGRGG